MSKKTLLLIAIVPLLNFLHESGHWLGGRLVGAEPKMLLQRVDIGDETRFSDTQILAYNWAGPAINYTLIGMSLFRPALTPMGLLMVCHRLGPNLFATFLYLSGNRNFTTDETKQFSKENRLSAAVVFSILYLAIAILLVVKWVPASKRLWAWVAIPGLCVMWFGYLMLLDFLDNVL